jgi:hypothetical protein
VKAIQEMDIKVQAIESFDEENENKFVMSLRVWLSNASNKITRIFTGELCLIDESGAQECINTQELKELKTLLNKPSTETIHVDTSIEAEKPEDSTLVEDENSATDTEVVQIEEVSEIVE